LTKCDAIFNDISLDNLNFTLKFFVFTIEYRICRLNQDYNITYTFDDVIYSNLVALTRLKIGAIEVLTCLFDQVQDFRRYLYCS